jgi:hypothetical protein
MLTFYLWFFLGGGGGFCIHIFVETLFSVLYIVIHSLYFLFFEIDIKPGVNRHGALNAIYVVCLCKY